MANRQKKKLSILHLIASPAIGGSEKLLLTLAQKIDKEKFEITLGVFVDKLDPASEPFWNEATQLDLTVAPIRISGYGGVRQIVELWRLIKKCQPDIIHTHGYKTNILGVIMAKLFKTPIIATVHGWFFPKNS